MWGKKSDVIDPGDICTQHKTQKFKIREWKSTFQDKKKTNSEHFFRIAVMPQRELRECDLRLSQMTMVRQVVPCKPEGVHSGAQIHLQSQRWFRPPENSLPHLSLNEGIVTSQGKRYSLWNTFKGFFGGGRKTQQNSQTKSNKRQRPSD